MGEPIQPLNWAWGTYRQNWTAYPAERRTLTCLTPTRRPPPTARTHEGTAVCPPPPSYPASLILHVPCLSALSLHHQDAGRKRDAGGGGEQGSAHGFASPPSPNSHPVPRPLFSTPPPLPRLHFFSTWLLRRRGELLFFTVTYKTVCYVRVGEALQGGGGGGVE